MIQEYRRNLFVKKIRANESAIPFSFSESDNEIRNVLKIKIISNGCRLEFCKKMGVQRS